MQQTVGLAYRCLRRDQVLAVPKLQPSAPVRPAMLHVAATGRIASEGGMADPDLAAAVLLGCRSSGLPCLCGERRPCDEQAGRAGINQQGCDGGTLA